ncbi:hypothetical protein AB6A40_010087 [Gnathostoma spinigerum]|uniref:G-protein coupled receptors family 1 profile domain-containing protein n=1 Tax=Gnathostoma spinigerum TaxID=75299 RepID=A0ABD6ETU5_9BILA
MVLFATVERLAIMSNWRYLKYLQRSKVRCATVLILLLLIFILRIPAFFNYVVEYNSRCPPFRDYSFVPNLSALKDYPIYNFYVITILQIFLPFLFLLLLNFAIIYLTRHRLYETALGQPFKDMPKLSSLLKKESLKVHHSRRSELKYATRTMVTIVFSYLCCNIFSVFISLMENLFSDSPLLFNEDGTSTYFYTIAADVISILFVICSAIRLILYLICNPRLRVQLIIRLASFRCFKQFLSNEGKPRLGAISWCLSTNDSPQSSNSSMLIHLSLKQTRSMPADVTYIEYRHNGKSILTDKTSYSE